MSRIGALLALAGGQLSVLLIATETGRLQQLPGKYPRDALTHTTSTAVRPPRRHDTVGSWSATWARVVMRRKQAYFDIIFPTYY